MYNFNDILSKRSLKVTPQRLTILKIIDKYGHISIDDIFNEIKQLFPSLSLATIYKNIHALKDAGVLSEIHIKDAKPKFEIKKQPHGHFICKKCGNVFDFEIQNSCNPDLKDIKSIDESEIYLYGICKNCI